VKAIILVGGLGTRLRPLTLNTPKALVPVLNVPFLEHILRYLKSFGIDRVILTLSHLAPAIKEYFGNGECIGMDIEYAIEPFPLGTAGAVRNAAEHFTDTFLVLNGDIYTEMNLDAMLDFHKRNGAQATIALTPVDNPSAYGLVETDGRQCVTRFVEKPRSDEITTNMINAGIYILEPDVLNKIPFRQVFSFEKELFPALLLEGSRVLAFKDSGYWIDIGTPHKYQKLNNDLLCGQGKQYGFLRGDEIRISPGCRIHPTARLMGPVLIGGNCKIDADVTITGPSVIGRNCRIEDGATIKSSIIWQDVTLSHFSCVQTSIVAHECHLDSGSHVEGSILGDHVKLASDYHLEPGSSILPGEIIG
jgi:mannose-1-phosphate guanylyltransferase